MKKLKIIYEDIISITIILEIFKKKKNRVRDKLSRRKRVIKFMKEAGWLRERKEANATRPAITR